MGVYETAQICLNGHTVTTSLEGSGLGAGFCSDCGAATTSQCTACHAPIRGHYHVDGVFPIGDDYTPASATPAASHIPGRKRECAPRPTWPISLMKNSSASSPTLMVQMDALLKNLVLDRWYKVTTGVGAILIFIALTVDTRWLTNKQTGLAGADLFFIGLGAWKNIKHRVESCGRHPTVLRNTPSTA